MTQQRALSPLALLLASLLCYGFVLVWTQNVALETTTTLEDHSSPFLPDGVKILSGGNFSVSVAPWERTTEPPAVSTQSHLALHRPIIENATTVIPEDGITFSPPTTMESLSTMEVTTEDELISGIDRTEGQRSTTINTGRQGSATESGAPTGGSTGMPENGITAPSSLIENRTKGSSGTTIASGTTDTTATSTGVRVRGDLYGQPRSLKKTSSTGGSMAWRVKLRSSLSREKAITTFFEKSCELIIKKLRMKDISITWGPHRTTTKCV